MTILEEMKQMRDETQYSVYRTRRKTSPFRAGM